jgi:hypothetical protein
MQVRGIDINGKEIRYGNRTNGTMIFCSNRNLVSLEIPEGITHIACSGNLIKELHLPDTIEIITCDEDVKLTGNLNCVMELCL